MVVMAFILVCSLFFLIVMQIGPKKPTYSLTSFLTFLRFSSHKEASKSKKEPIPTSSSSTNLAATSTTSNSNDLNTPKSYTNEYNESVHQSLNQTHFKKFQSMPFPSTGSPQPNTESLLHSSSNQSLAQLSNEPTRPPAYSSSLGTNSSRPFRPSKLRHNSQPDASFLSSAFKPPASSSISQFSILRNNYYNHCIHNDYYNYLVANPSIFDWNTLYMAAGLSSEIEVSFSSAFDSWH